MTQTSLDRLGPVDFLIVEFPEGESVFTGELAQLLAAEDMENLTADRSRQCGGRARL